MNAHGFSANTNMDTDAADPHDNAENDAAAANAAPEQPSTRGGDDDGAKKSTEQPAGKERNKVSAVHFEFVKVGKHLQPCRRCSRLVCGVCFAVMVCQHACILS